MFRSLSRVSLHISCNSVRQSRGVSVKSCFDVFAIKNLTNELQLAKTLFDSKISPAKFSESLVSHVVKEGLPYKSRDQTSADIVNYFLKRVTRRLEHSKHIDECISMDKGNNVLTTLHGIPGSGKSSFLAHFPYSQEYAEYFQKRLVMDPEMTLSNDPTEGMFNFESPDSVFTGESADVTACLYATSSSSDSSVKPLSFVQIVSGQSHFLVLAVFALLFLSLTWYGIMSLNVSEKSSRKRVSRASEEEIRSEYYQVESNTGMEEKVPLVGRYV